MSRWGGGQVQLVGGWSGQSADGRGGQVQPGGGVSILRPLAGGMPLAFTQEDFLVLSSFKGLYIQNATRRRQTRHFYVKNKYIMIR